MSEATFIPGDIIVMDGETYQVLEDHGNGGTVIPFPIVEGIDSERVEWAEQKAGCRRIGNAPLPAPSPCATSGGSCPTDGRLDMADSAPSNPNLIAKA